MASSNPSRLSAQLSPFDGGNAASGRQSPFRRQNSQSPATTARPATPTTSPTKHSVSLSPTKPSSLSLEKGNVFVRRPSQISNGSDRPASPFARPTSSLSVVTSPPPQPSDASLRDSTPEPQQSLAVRRALGAPALSESNTATISPQVDETRQSSAGATTNVVDKSFYGAPISPTSLRPSMQRKDTSSTSATIKPPIFSSPQAIGTTPKFHNMGGNGYNHVSQPLLHSMRESFEVLDSSNTGTINSAAVSEILSQMGLDNNPAALGNFFPPNAPAQLNLARYLDTLSSPLAELSQPEELRAAFEAFDVDDSGQIDLPVLRDALLYTAPQPGEAMVRLSEREVDGILGEFTSRRAFGAKGMSTGKVKGEVFRYRDFMGSVSGSGSTALPENSLAV